MNAAVIYWSKTGNTEKVASSIREGLEAGGFEVVDKRLPGVEDFDFFDFDLVCCGFPSYQWRPPKPVDECLRGRMAHYRREHRVLPGAPSVSGQNALVFCTYSGPHTGIPEAIPAIPLWRFCLPRLTPLASEAGSAYRPNAAAVQSPAWKDTRSPTKVSRTCAPSLTWDRAPSSSSTGI